MKMNELRVGFWYRFTNYRKIVSYCKYLGVGPQDRTGYLYGGRHVFHFLDGDEYDYSPGGISTSMKPCFKSFSDYLNLFGAGSQNEH